MTQAVANCARAVYPRWLAYGELGVVLLLAPWFVFPDPALTPWLMCVPLGLWGLRYAIAKRLTTRTPLDVPLLLLAVMVCVGALVTVDSLRSFPKIVGVYYAIVVFYTLINHLRYPVDVWIATGGLIVAGDIVALIALLDTNWSKIKIPVLNGLLQPLYQLIPDVVLRLPRAETGFNANQVGGTLALLIPLLVPLTLRAWVQTLERKSVPRFLLSLASTASCLLTGLAIILTQSRGALVAVLVALGMLLIVYSLSNRWFLIALGVLGVAVIGLLVMNPPVSVSDGDLERVISLSGRLEIWHRSLRALQGHPLTGIGFDNLVAIIHARYPTFVIPAAGDFTHAHNIFLQVALDLGIPGLVAFVAVLLITFWQLIRGYRTISEPLHRALSLGLALGLSAQMVFGLVDAIALGQKPGLFFWVYLALATVIAEPSIANKTG